MRVLHFVNLAIDSPPPATTSVLDPTTSNTGHAHQTGHYLTTQHPVAPNGSIVWRGRGPQLMLGRRPPYEQSAIPVPRNTLTWCCYRQAACSRSGAMHQ